MDIIGTFAFFLVFFGIIATISLVQQNQSKKIVKSLSHRNLQHLRIYFNQIVKSKFTINGGLNIKAEMYFDNELILICPKRGNLFNGLFNFNLPIVFTREIDKVYKEINKLVILSPNQINMTSNNVLIIKYEEGSSIGKGKYSIRIKVIDKEDKRKMDLVKETNLFLYK